MLKNVSINDVLIKRHVVFIVYFSR